jgi:hypothetical protein
LRRSLARERPTSSDSLNFTDWSRRTYPLICPVLISFAWPPFVLPWLLPDGHSCASRGDREGLLGVLDPDLVVRADMAAGAPTEIRGAAVWAKGAVAYGHLARLTQPALVDGPSASSWRRGDDW